MDNNIDLNEEGAAYLQPKKDVFYKCPACGGDGKETCNNPDHSFIDSMPGDVGRLGCPVCGHDQNYKVNRGKNVCPECGGYGHVIPEVFEEYGRETGYDEDPEIVQPKPLQPYSPDGKGELWVVSSERLPGVYKVVKWRNGRGGNIPLGENTFIDQYNKVGANTCWHEWLDESAASQSGKQEAVELLKGFVNAYEVLNYNINPDLIERTKKFLKNNKQISYEK